MVNTDHVQTGTTTHSCTITGGDGTNTCANTHDGDFDTHYQVADVSAASGTGSISDVTIISEHTFAAAQTITQLTFKPYGAAATDTSSLVYNKYIKAWADIYDGSWTNVWSYEETETGEGSITYDPGSTSQGGNWTSVTKVRVKVQTYSRGDNNSDSTARIYEVQAWGMVLEPDNEKCYSGVI